MQGTKAKSRLLRVSLLGIVLILAIVFGISPLTALATPRLQIPTPTDTPTDTPVPPTRTPTYTPTPTNTPFPPTNTPTDTPTNTPFPPTPTPTDTPTNTPFPPTNTPTPTNTPFPPTNTPTDTLTNTPFPPTSTPTDTPTNTPIAPTPTPTDTPTNTPIAPTPTPTDTPTNTPIAPTPTPTDTPTNTPLPPTYTPTPTPIAFEGCSPGYWKNHLNAWAATGYARNQTLESVFDVPDSLGMDNNTLIHALRYPGGPGRSGGARILLRVAVAALLNSADPIVDYPRTTAKVIADVNAALASGNRSLMLALATKLDADNNLGCPLNGGSGHDDSGNVAGPLTGNNMLFLPIVDSE